MPKSRREHSLTSVKQLLKLGFAQLSHRSCRLNLGRTDVPCFLAFPGQALRLGFLRLYGEVFGREHSSNIIDKWCNMVPKAGFLTFLALRSVGQHIKGIPEKVPGRSSVAMTNSQWREAIWWRSKVPLPRDQGASQKNNVSCRILRAIQRRGVQSGSPRPQKPRRDMVSSAKVSLARMAMGAPPGHPARHRREKRNPRDVGTSHCRP